MRLDINHIGQIALPVADVDRAEAFYRDVLGLPQLYRFGDLTFFDCAGVRLMLEKTDDPASAPRSSVIYFRCADIALAVREYQTGATRAGAIEIRSVEISPIETSPIEMSPIDLGSIDLIVSGGGVHNPRIMGMLAGYLPGVAISTSTDHGIGADAKEAIAFAVLAHETWRRRPSNLPSATGARHAAILGSITHGGA